MRVDNEKELEMNKYEKMSYELIEEKKKVKLDLEKTYIISFGFFMATLLVWGVLFVLNRFSLNGFLIPEFGIILPIALIFSYGFFLFSKNARG